MITRLYKTATSKFVKFTYSLSEKGLKGFGYIIGSVIVLLFLASFGDRLIGHHQHKITMGCLVGIMLICLAMVVVLLQRGKRAIQRLHDSRR